MEKFDEDDETNEKTFYSFLVEFYEERKRQEQIENKIKKNNLISAPDQKKFLKNRKKGISSIVREKYLRDDISCCRKVCSICSPNSEIEIKIKKEPPKQKIIFPSLSICIEYLEILEILSENQKTIGDFAIIFLQTVFNQLEWMKYRRTKNRMRNLILDLRRDCGYIANENFSKTFQTNENLNKNQQIENTYILTIQWIKSHLESAFPQKMNTKKIELFFLFSKQDFFSKNEKFLKDLEIPVFTPLEYLLKHHSEKKELIFLCESLETVISEKLKRKELKNSTNLLKENHLFESYYKEDELNVGIKNGHFLQGKFIMFDNRRKSEVLILSNPLFSSKFGNVLIPKEFQNRAINGDKVAVELIEENQLKNQDNLQFQKNQKNQKIGKIVGILSREHFGGNPIVGTIELEKNYDIQEIKKKESFLVVPLDRKFPKIRIRTQVISQIMDSRILVQIDSWDKDSHFPTGHFVKTIGPIGDLSTETQSILISRNFNLLPFSDVIIESLPKENWIIPEEEYQKRRDLRDILSCSIDPIGCQDIDDVLSAVRLKNGNIQIGIHIADTSYFVKQDSFLDIEARSRGTTVYMSENRFDMLPTIISTNVCSLREKKDRLTLSVLVEFDGKSGNQVGNPWFGRTIINSSHELSYEVAEEIINDSLKEEEKKKLGDFKKLQESLLLLVQVARQLREGRLSGGGIELASTQLKFELNDSKNPTKIINKEDAEIHKIVAELMIYANGTVAEKIYDTFPSCSLLRKHPSPRLHRFEYLENLVSKIHLKIDPSSNKTLSESLDLIEKKYPKHSNVIRNLTTLSMEEAEYVSTGSVLFSNLYHYGLNLNLYTHFTSPIRRYADILVHRQLLASLEKNPPPMNDGQLSETCLNLNIKNRTSKIAQRESSILFQGLYFKNNKVQEEAIIYGFQENEIQVFVPKYGIYGNVKLRDEEGNFTIPTRGIFPLNLDWTLSDFEIHSNGLMLHAGNKKAGVSFFDSIFVEMAVEESRYHLPKIELKLVSFQVPKESSQEFNGIRELKVTSNSLLSKLKAEPKNTLQDRVPAVYLPDYNNFSQDETSFYQLLQQIKERNNNENENESKDEEINKEKEKEKENNKITSKTKGNQVIRLWKLTKQQKKDREKKGGGVQVSQFDSKEKEKSKTSSILSVQGSKKLATDYTFTNIVLGREQQKKNLIRKQKAHKNNK